MQPCFKWSFCTIFWTLWPYMICNYRPPAPALTSSDPDTAKANNKTEALLSLSIQQCTNSSKISAFLIIWSCKSLYNFAWCRSEVIKPASISSPSKKLQRYKTSPDHLGANGDIRDCNQLFLLHGFLNQRHHQIVFLLSISKLFPLHFNTNPRQKETKRTFKSSFQIGLGQL